MISEVGIVTDAVLQRWDQKVNAVDLAREVCVSEVGERGGGGVKGGTSKGTHTHTHIHTTSEPVSETFSTMSSTLRHRQRLPGSLG